MGERGGEEEKGSRAWLELKPKPEVVRSAAGEAQEEASVEAQAAMRARFSCS